MYVANSCRAVACRLSNSAVMDGEGRTKYAWPARIWSSTADSNFIARSVRSCSSSSRSVTSPVNASSDVLPT